MSAARALRQLEALRLEFGAGAAARKLTVLALLAPLRFSRADQLLRYHEALCFMAAYPDNPRLLGAVRRALAEFPRRTDLARLKDALASSGIAGTPTHYNFFWMMSRWLAGRFPHRLVLDWEVKESAPRLAAALPVLLPWLKAEAVKRSSLDLRVLIERLRGGQTDAAFLLRAIAALPGDDFTREHFHDAIDSAYTLGAAPGFPSRTLARHTNAPLVFRKSAPPAGRPDLPRELQKAPHGVRPVQGAEARAVLDLAREAMLTRARDLAAFSWGDERDVTMVDDGDGLAFALIGSIPERRLPLPAVHGWIILRNRVPVGYVQTDTLLGGSELSFNIFSTFRGAEAGYLFARVMAVARHVLGARSFSLEPYQLGEGNDEGIASGAWWFYYKFGFRPIAEGPQRVLAAELARMRRRPEHRSGEATLRSLAAGHMVLEPEPGVRAWLPLMPALGLSPALAIDAAAAGRALLLLEARGEGRWPQAERMAVERLAPVICAMPQIARWRPAEKQGALAVLRAKGGRREIDFVRGLDAHPKLSDALKRLLVRAAKAKA